MADGVLITAGSGTTIATDQLADNSHVQLVKLVDGTADSTTRIPGPTGGLHVQGGTAHGTAAANNPLQLAGTARIAEVGAVDGGDVVRLMADLVGRLVVSLYAIPEIMVSGVTADITTTASTQVIAAGAAGVRNYITSLLVQNSAGAVSTWVNITDGSGGASLYTVYALQGGGGAAITLLTPLRTTAATALHAACVTTAANVRVSASGYRGV